jgi:hypothetical protein
MSDAVGVTYELLHIERVANAGALIGLASVELAVAGVCLVLQGVQVRKQADGTLSCVAPQFRHARSGRWLPCLLLPEALSAAIAHEVLSALTDPRTSITPNSGALAA